MADTDIQKISKINGAILVDENAQQKINEINEKFEEGGEYNELKKEVKEDLSNFNELKTELENTSIGIKKEFIYSVVKKINNCINLMKVKFGNKFNLSTIDIDTLDDITDAEELITFLEQIQESISNLSNFIHAFYPEEEEGFIYKNDEGSFIPRKIIDGSDLILQKTDLTDKENINFESISSNIPTVSAVNEIITLRVTGDLKNILIDKVASVNKKIDNLEKEISKLDSLYIDSLITFYDVTGNSLDNYNNILLSDLNLGAITDENIKKDSFVIFNNSADNVIFTYTDIIDKNDTPDQIAAKTHSFELSPRQFKKFIKIKKENDEGIVSYYLEEMFRDGIVEPSEAEGQSFINDETISKRTVWSSDKVNKFVEGAGNTLSWTGTKAEWEEYIKNNADKVKEGQQVNITDDEGNQSIEIINDGILANNSTWSSKKIMEFTTKLLNEIPKNKKLIFEKTNPDGESGFINIPEKGYYYIELSGGKGGKGGNGGAGGDKTYGTFNPGGEGGEGGEGKLFSQICKLEKETYNYIIGSTGGAGKNGGNGGGRYISGMPGGEGGEGGTVGSGYKFYTNNVELNFVIKGKAGSSGATNIAGSGGGGGTGGTGGITALYNYNLNQEFYAYGGFGGCGGGGSSGWVYYAGDETLNGKKIGGDGGGVSNGQFLLSSPGQKGGDDTSASNVTCYGGDGGQPGEFIINFDNYNDLLTQINLQPVADVSSTIRIYKLS